jgi:hypothetical protein
MSTKNIKYINCFRCGAKIRFKGGKHKYCSSCKVIVDKEKQKIRDWKRVIARRRKEADKRLCKCPICGVEFSRLSQGSNKQYCGSSECEHKRSLRNSYKSNTKIRDKHKKVKLSVIKSFANNHGIGFDFSTFDGERLRAKGRNKVFTGGYVDFCLNKCGYKRLSEYINSATLLDLECPNGHRIQISFGNFLNKDTRCNICKSKLGIGATHPLFQRQNKEAVSASTYI